MRVPAGILPCVVPALLALHLLTPAAAAQTGHRLALEVPRDDQKGPNLNFERAQLRPFELSGDGSRLYTLNSHGARLVAFDAVSDKIVLEIPIGIGAVSLARRPGTEELWVVDEIASSVFVVDPLKANIVRTIRVGGLPHGIVFTPSGDRAYVTCSGVDRVDVIASSTYQVVHSIPVPVRDPRGITWLNGHAWIVPLRSGNNTAPYGTLSDPDHAIGVRKVLGGGLNALPDRDLLAIATAPNPTQDQLDPSKTRTGLGTTLFDVCRRPGTSELWIPHTEALNAEHKGRTNFVAGQVVRNRITVVDTSSSQPPQVIDLDVLAPPGSEVAQPTHVAFDASGSRAYVSGFGTDTVAVLDVSGSAVTWLGAIELTAKQLYPVGVGPRVTRVDPTGKKLWVYGRVDNALGVVDLTSLPTSANFHVTLPPGISLGYDPISDEERQGRGMFRNARFSKSSTSSCASCHVDGHTDGLAWDLSDYLDPEGTPDNQLTYPQRIKGPLVTLSNRRLQETGPFHWRGEKPGLLDFQSIFPELLENQVNGGPGVLGQEFQYIRHYINRLLYPPNPHQSLDRELTPLERKGAMIFTHKRVLGELSCASCHQLPLGTSGEIVPQVVDGVTRSGVVPSLRGLTDKLSPPHAIGGPFGTRTELGAGLSHSGVIADLRGAILRPDPAQPGTSLFNLTTQDVDALEAFLKGFDWGLAPAAGFAATAHAGNAGTIGQTDLLFLEDQAERGNCDLIYYRTPRWIPGTGMLFMTGRYDPQTGTYEQNSELPPDLTRAFLLAEAAAGRPVTFLGVPLGMGHPLGVDRDMDELWDYDEGREGTDPESWDTDGDLLPDGYEFDWNTDPLSVTTSTPDTQGPALVAPAELVWATTNTLKFEIDLNEPATVHLFYNGGPFVQRLPLGPPEFARHHDIVLEQLEADTSYTIGLLLTDPSGNVTTDTSNVFETRPFALASPAYVNEIQVSIAYGTPNVHHTQVELMANGQPVGAGYVVTGSLIHVLVGGLSMISPSLQATTGTNGVATFQQTLPPPSGAGAAVFVLQDVVSPAGSPPWILALDKVSQTAIHY